MPSAVPMQMFFKQFHRGPVVQGSGMGRAAHPLYYSRRRVGLDSLIPKVLSNLNDSTKRCREGGGPQAQKPSGWLGISIHGC